MKKTLCLAVIIFLTGVSTFAQRVITVLPAGGQGGDALSIDERGNVYASDFAGGGTSVLKITRGGEVSVYATGFNGAAGSAFDSQGNLFVANFNSNEISKVTPNGAVSTFASGFLGPVGVVVDDRDNVFVTNAGVGRTPGYKINKIRPNGTVSTFVDFATVDPSFLALGGLAQDDAGNFYVSNFINGKIKKITRRGVATDFATIPGNISFETGPLGYLTYSCGNLYITYIGGNVVYRVSLAGEVSLFAGTGQAGEVDGRVLSAQFNGPNGIVATRRGNLYVSDFNTRALRKIIGIRRADDDD